MSTQSIMNRIMSGSLVLQIAVGIVAGVALSQVSPPAAKATMLLGNLFVQALKAVRSRAGVSAGCLLQSRIAVPAIPPSCDRSSSCTSRAHWQRHCWRSP